MNEAFAITTLERMYMTQTRKNTYLACEDMDFVWDERDVKEVEHMWNGGLSIQDIAKSFERDPDEVLVLIIDLARKGKIDGRKGGARGARRPDLRTTRSADWQAGRRKTKAIRGQFQPSGHDNQGTVPERCKTRTV